MKLHSQATRMEKGKKGVKSRGCSSAGKMEKSIRSARVKVRAHDRWTGMVNTWKLKPQTFPNSTTREPAAGSRGSHGKGKRETDYSVLRSQAMCLQKAWPRAAAKYFAQLGDQGNGQGKSLKQARGSPGKCRLVGLAFGFVGGK